jgi:type I restriction enzyme M protein
MDEIKMNDYNLNISRYVSTSEDQIEIDLNEVNKKLIGINEKININTKIHNEFLRELGLNLI